MSNLSFGDDPLQGARDEHTELLQLTRHYSGLRFVMLPIFVTVTAGLLSARFGTTVVSSNWWLRSFCALAGIIIAAVFFKYEFDLSKDLSDLGKRLCKLETTLTYQRWGERYVNVWGQITVVNLLLYALLLLFWISALFGLVGDVPEVLVLGDMYLTFQDC
jgi:hypothetical protein